MRQFQRAKPGEPFSVDAATWNAMIDAAEAHANNSNATPLQRGGGRATTALVKNITNGAVPRFGVLQVNDPVIDPADSAEAFNGRSILTGATPSATNLEARLAIMQEPTQDEELARAVIDGVTPAVIEILDANHTRADIKDGDNTELVSAEVGPLQVLWKETGTGTGKRAVVRFGADVDCFAAEITSLITNDTLVVQRLDGDGVRVGSSMIVAKPYKLRHVAANYEWATSITSTDTNTVEASDGTNTYTWRVTPDGYAVGDIIYIQRVQYTGVTVGSDLKWIDLNVDGRAWATDEA